MLSGCRTRILLEVVPVDDAHAAVDDGLFHRGKPIFAADDQLAQRQNEVGFQAQRVILRLIPAETSY